MIRMYSAYDPPDQVLVMCTAEEGRAKQSEFRGTDINVIVKQYQQTGMLPQVQPGQFLDVSVVADYREALAEVRLAESFFSSLPAEVRAEFANDPAEFLDFATDPQNRARMQELKLIPADPVVSDPVVPDADGVVVP